jgi:hypothetical protein
MLSLSVSTEWFEMVGWGHAECIERGCRRHERELALSDAYEVARQKTPGSR